jgi:hypothetical protein
MTELNFWRRFANHIVYLNDSAPEHPKWNLLGDGIHIAQQIVDYITRPADLDSEKLGVLFQSSGEPL